jgi:hypothetical protein
MNCPNCGAPEKARVKICPKCEHAYASQDLIELRQLEFLLEETNTWQIDDTLRYPYKQRLDLLADRLQLKPKEPEAKPPEPEVAPAPVPEPAKPYVVINTRTKVFNGPGKDSSQLGFASAGKKFRVTGVSRNKKWLRIKISNSVDPSGQGWISAYAVTVHHGELVPVIQDDSLHVEGAPEPSVEKPEPAPPPQPKEKVPFDQWLLSERNIKIALYSGGLLLLIAGIIFIGVNWTRIPGPGKFAITLMITGLMYLGGYLLVQRPAYKIGGVALLGIASGFFVLNFAVLQIYVMGPRGLTDNMMWLIASPFCLLLYMLTAYWTKSDLFTYFSLFALGSTLTAGLVLAGAPELVYLLAFSFLGLVLLFLAQGLKRTQLSEFTYQPLLIVAHVLIPLTFLWALVILLVGVGPLPMITGSLWLSLVVLVVGSAFYTLNAYWHKSLIPTYLCLVTVGITITAALYLANVPVSVYLLTFSVLAIVLSILSQRLKSAQLAEFTCQPFMITAHILTPLTFLFALVILIIGEGPLPLDTGSLWLSLVVLVVGSAFYTLNAYWFKSPIPTYLSLITVGITITAALYLARVPISVYLVSYGCLSVLMLVLARLARNSQGFNFTYSPLLILSNLLMPLTFMASFFYLIVPADLGSRWFTLLIFGLGAVFYMTVAYWRFHILFSYASLGAVAGLVFALLFLLEVPLLVYPLVFAVFATICLILARLSQDTTVRDFTRFPLLSASQVLMPATIFFAVAGWISHELIAENPWLPLITLGLGVLFYILTDVLFKRLEARWAVAVLVPISSVLLLYELNFSLSSIGISLMILAILYMGCGYILEQRENRKVGGWPFYATAYAMSTLVTILAIPDRADLAKILFADVVILAISAAIHRVYWWVHGAAWLFILPYYLTISLYVAEFHYQGLLMGLLGVNYVAAGFILGRRKLKLGAPFLMAAAFLSVITIGLTWSNPVTAALVMSAIAILFLMVGIWLGWSWLLLPTLVLLNLIVLTVNILLSGYEPPLGHALLISYTVLGSALILGGLFLQRTNQDRWSWPLYTLGAINIIGSYVISLRFVDWITVGISGVLAVLMFSFAWLERQFITKYVKIPLLTYLGIGILFIAHFVLLFLVAGQGSWDSIWPPYTAGLCGIFILFAWLLQRDPLESIYSVPLRWSGLGLLGIPMWGSLIIFIVSLTIDPDPVIVAVTFAIAGVAIAGDAVMRRSLREAYFSFGSLIIVIWAVLYALNIHEPQAYIIPVGLTILGIGWYEKTQEEYLLYKLLTYTGLVLLMGTAFIQSIPQGAYLYAILVGVEGMLSIAWGIRSHCRCFVQIGSVALIANAVVQLGPGFIDLPRWIQIGLTGAILLGGGMAALFKREQILDTRQRITDEWRQWNP